MSDVAQRFLTVREAVSAAARDAGRDPREVCLVAVSKRHSAASIVAAFEAGARDFGESYVQELVAKRAEVEAMLGARSAEIRWHFVGNLQRNKVKHLGRVHLIHTLDSARLLRTIEARGEGVGGVLIQVRIGGEASKAGIEAQEVETLAQEVASSTLPVRGLMTIGPPRDCQVAVRGDFARLRELRDEVASRHRLDWPHLSMGMSTDFAPAISEGATLVRVGTAIFGTRAP
jgi:pyridoxal phosphate enzyme (YggS family)